MRQSLVESDPSIFTGAAAGGDLASQLRLWWRRLVVLLKVAVVLSPTLLSVVYYGFVATGRYVSEARFVIHTASKATGSLGGLSAILQMIGLSRSQDDAYSVRDYLTSRNAVAELRQKVDLNAIYNRRNVDPISRFPSVIFENTEEGFYRYFQHAISVYVNTTSGLTVLQAEAFRPEDAELIASRLLEQGEALINRLNERALQDAVHVAQDEVSRAETRRVAAQLALTDFRTKALMLDPTHNATMLVGLIGHLSEQLAAAKADLAETMANSRDSPQLASMRQRIEALSQQIDKQTAQISSGSDGLADKIAQYETLTLQEQFAIRALDQAIAGLENARTEARRQQLFLERVVDPVVADEPMEPRRLETILSVLGFNIIGAGIVWLIASGLREHASGGG